MVSNASEDLPEPDTPVTTVRVLCGTSKSMFLRLWTRAPRTTILSVWDGVADIESGPTAIPELERERSDGSGSQYESFYYKGFCGGQLYALGDQKPLPLSSRRKSLEGAGKRTGVSPPNLFPGLDPGGGRNGRST